MAQDCVIWQLICPLWALVNKSSEILLGMQSEVLHWVCDYLLEVDPALYKGICYWKERIIPGQVMRDDATRRD